jgi:hypothetical protein
MTDKPNQTPTAAAVMADLATLTHNLRNSFRIPSKSGIDDTITLQARYVVALGNVAEFLGRGGAGEDVAQKFIELAGALDNLRNGVVAEVLSPTSFGGGRGPDGTVAWSYRFDVVIGLECILRSGKKNTNKEAAEHIARKYPAFDRLKRDPSDTLSTSVLSWRRQINEGKVPESKYMQAHQHKFFEQHANLPPSEMFALGERLLAEAAERTTKAVF